MYEIKYIESSYVLVYVISTICKDIKNININK